MTDGHELMAPPVTVPRRRRRRRYGWAVGGALAGVVVYGVVLAVTVLPVRLGEYDAPQGEAEALAMLGYLFLAAAVTLVLLIAGGLLCAWPRPRRFGVGLLIGTAIGLIGASGVAFAIL